MLFLLRVGIEVRVDSAENPQVIFVLFLWYTNSIKCKNTSIKPNIANGVPFRLLFQICFCVYFPMVTSVFGFGAHISEGFIGIFILLLSSITTTNTQAEGKQHAIIMCPKISWQRSVSAPPNNRAYGKIRTRGQSRHTTGYSANVHTHFTHTTIWHVYTILPCARIHTNTPHSGSVSLPPRFRRVSACNLMFQ